MATIRGGEKAKKAIADLVERVGSGKRLLKVGFLTKAKYPDGKPVAMIAAIQNYGAPSRGIPPRPFFSNVVNTKSKDWPAATAGLLKQTNYDVDQTLRKVGEGIVGQIRQSIVDTNTPALAPATAKRKGFDKPLVDTGHMLNSVDYEVTGS